MGRNGSDESLAVEAYRQEAEHKSKRGVTRRTALKAGAATSAMLSLSKLPCRAASSGNTLDKERFLVSYAGNGFRHRDYLACQQDGYSNYLTKLLNPGMVSDDRWEGVENTYPQVLKWNANQTLGFAGPYGIGNYWPLVRHAQLIRSYLSERQLLEVFSAFLSQNMLNVHGGDVAIGLPLFYSHYLQVARNSAGLVNVLNWTYGQLLHEVARSPAMLQYLNNNTSCVQNPGDIPNENWARELLELYSVGQQDFAALWPGGQNDYQTDIVEVARIFTGWQYSKDVPPYFPGQPVFGTFTFNYPIPNCHDTGTKSLSFLNPGGPKVDFGPNHGDTPVGEGERLIGLLGVHPSTAANFAAKACATLLMDNPTTALVTRIQNEFVLKQGNLKDVLAAMFDDFFLDDPVDGWFPESNPLFLTPARFMAWTIRSLDLPFEITNPGGGTESYDQALVGMGHALGEHAAPDGYPVGVDAWQDTLQLRWRHAYKLATNQYSFLDFNTDRLDDFFRGSMDSSAAQWADDHLTGGLLTPEEVNLIQLHFNFTMNNGGDRHEGLREIIALVFAAPSAQWLCG